MIACYVRGGGLGHLTRIRAYLHTCHPGETATILTTSPFTADPRVLGPHRLLPAVALPSLHPSTLVVDAFPAGLDGELSAASIPRGTRTVHLARLLRWDAYLPLLPADPVRFDETWLLEDLTPEHRAHFPAAAPLTLTDPPESTPRGAAEGSWLIVHSGPAPEIHELIGYARDCATAEGIRPRLLLAAPSAPHDLPEDVAHIDPYPAWPLFAEAARVITAAGFNAVRQTRPWRSKHLMLPFPRRWDDQYTRAAAARRPASAQS
ncbi:hypothetical protein [Actinoplanes subglobosus]|uniref:Glycosyltransferase n=1 Tax=Actinoplanes subglobosus TaxID=1547892 RepID=A0ABV8J489_9ACTN